MKHVIEMVKATNPRKKFGYKVEYVISCEERKYKLRLSPETFKMLVNGRFRVRRP